MTPLPSGTVTFLFTDVEGSTRRWEQHPTAMDRAIARHDAILKRSIEEHRGAVFKTVGDAFCASFSTAPQALRAALSAQRALAAEAWDDECAIRVRMAVHTGAAVERDGDYFGPPVNRVARLLSAGHGGQILLSGAAQELVRDVLPPRVDLRDLGEHRLKDLARPERIFQAVAPDLGSDFPPLKVLDRRPHNLPVQPTPLIGRQREVRAVCDLLRQDGVRLVTLTGPGGTGKTRLALQVAAELLDELPDGAYVVSLASIADPDLVLPAVAATLGLAEAGEGLVDTLTASLRDMRLLLVLDNVEHLMPAAPAVGEILAACPDLKVLATSREALRLAAEREFPVPPLAVPEPRRLPSLDVLSQYDAVALFIQRARGVKPDFTVTNETAPAVAEICHRLDGLPLAIELAATRIRLFPPPALLGRLDRRLKILTGGARDLPARQQTLRGAIDWSYSLLDAGEQALFARLAVFAGGCTVEAAEAVCAADGPETDILEGVSSLVEKSLLKAGEDVSGGHAEPRFAMLETIREYAAERLERSGQADAVRRAHADFYGCLVREAAEQLTGADQATWLDRLEADHDNLRAALSWLLAGHDTDRAVGLAGDLGPFWEIRGHLTEGRRWLDRALAKTGGGDAAARARALMEAGALAMRQGDFARSAALHDEALVLCRELDDRQAVAGALNNLAMIAHHQGDYERSAALHAESLALKRELDDTWGVATSLNNLGIVSLDRGDLSLARSQFEQSLTLYRELEDGRGIASVLTNLGVVAMDLGDFRSTAARFEESLALYRALGDKRGVANALTYIGIVAQHGGDYDRATALHRESLALYRELGDKESIAECLGEIAAVAGGRGEPGEAAGLFGMAEALRQAIGARLPLAARYRYDRSLAAARAQLGEEAWNAAWQQGQAMTVQEVLARIEGM